MYCAVSHQSVSCRYHSDRESAVALYVLILRWCIAQDFEFDGIPEAWVVPMNEVVDELWIPSQYNRDIFVGDGVNGSKVTVPFLKPCMPSLGCDATRKHQHTFMPVGYSPHLIHVREVCLLFVSWAMLHMHWP